MPLESIHNLAFKAAEAARCAGEQGKYWEMHDRLFENQKTLEPWATHAQAIGRDGHARVLPGSDRTGKLAVQDPRRAERRQGVRRVQIGDRAPARPAGEGA